MVLAQHPLWRCLLTRRLNSVKAYSFAVSPESGSINQNGSVFAGSLMLRLFFREESWYLFFIELYLDSNADILISPIHLYLHEHLTCLVLLPA